MQRTLLTSFWNVFPANWNIEPMSVFKLGLRPLTKIKPSLSDYLVFAWLCVYTDAQKAEDVHRCLSVHPFVETLMGECLFLSKH